MLNKRNKVSILLIGLLFSFCLAVSETNNVALADNPNIKTSHSHLTGGWDANLIGSNGKHWTKYTQRNMGKVVYASIRISGKNQEAKTGSTTSAYVKSAHNVGPYVAHTHNGDMAK